MRNPQWTQAWACLHYLVACQRLQMVRKCRMANLTLRINTSSNSSNPCLRHNNRWPRRISSFNGARAKARLSGTKCNANKHHQRAKLSTTPLLRRCKTSRCHCSSHESMQLHEPGRGLDKAVELTSSHGLRRFAHPWIRPTSTRVLTRLVKVHLVASTRPSNAIRAVVWRSSR